VFSEAFAFDSIFGRDYSSFTHRTNKIFGDPLRAL